MSLSKSSSLIEISDSYLTRIDSPNPTATEESRPKKDKQISSVFARTIEEEFQKSYTTNDGYNILFIKERGKPLTAVVFDRSGIKDSSASPLIFFEDKKRDLIAEISRLALQNKKGSKFDITYFRQSNVIYIGPYGLRGGMPPEEEQKNAMEAAEQLLEGVKKSDQNMMLSAMGELDKCKIDLIFNPLIVLATLMEALGASRTEWTDSSVKREIAERTLLFAIGVFIKAKEGLKLYKETKREMKDFVERAVSLIDEKLRAENGLLFRLQMIQYVIDDVPTNKKTLTKIGEVGIPLMRLILKQELSGGAEIIGKAFAHYQTKRSGLLFEQVLFIDCLIKEKLPLEEKVLKTQIFLTIFSDTNWQIIYACLEALAKLVETGDDRQSQQTAFFGQSFKEEKQYGIRDCIDFNKFFTNSWRVREKCAEILIRLLQHKDDRIREEAHKLLIERKGKETDARVKLILDNPKLVTASPGAALGLKGKSPVIMEPAEQKESPVLRSTNELPRVVALKTIHPHYIFRKELEEKLDQAFATNPPSFLLYGPGGSGKSELATAFANRHISDFSLIFYLSCGSDEEIMLGYRNLASSLKINLDPKDTKEDIIRRVHQKLEHNTGKPWLLIFDNLNAPLPLPARGGLSLITGYAKSTSIKGLEVGRLTEEEAIELLQRVTEKKSPHLPELIKLIGRSPLLLDQAASYLARTETSVEEYIQLLNDGMSLQLDVDKRYEKTVEISFRMTVKRLTDPALEWLQICALLNPVNIPLSYLEQWLSKPYPYKVTRFPHMQEIRSALLDLALLRYDQETKTFSLHLESRKEVLKLGESPYKKAVALLLETGKKWNFENAKDPKKTIEEASIWASHALELLAGKDEKTVLKEAEKAEILQKLGDWEYGSVHFIKAQGYFEMALHISEKINAESQEVGACLSGLAECYSSQGKYAEALKLHEKALAIRKKVYGEEHPDVAAS